MPFINIFPSTSEKEAKQQAIRALVDNSSHSKDFYILLIGSILLAIGGIFADNVSILIASMIIAPLAYPILGLGLGIVVRDWRLVGRISILFAVSCLISLVLAAISTRLFSEIRVSDVYVTFTENHYLAVAVAVVSGVIAAYGTIRPKVATAITGVAIAVSLMPPLVALGIGVASANIELSKDAAILFLLNVVGVLAASIIVFIWFNIRSEYEASLAD
jgi:uncharacterized hydrophobic protein (TIGR00271 family)